jgi:DNA-binding transcriptional LysR family regulator
VTFKSDQLRYFVAVADEAQITRAARKLHIAQPALSQSIARLEDEVGVKLLARDPRGVTLTVAGEAFLARARLVLATEHDAEMRAEALMRASGGILEVGFIGPPPTMSTPSLFEQFRARYPEAELSLRDMPFPRGTTRSWLDSVDVAYCHAPAIEAGVAAQAVRAEPRAVVVRKSHRLAERAELTFADVLDETFISYHPDVQSAWAGFHSLDDHRGAPPRAMTVDRVETSLQMLGTLTTGRGITTVPFCDARLAQDVLPDVVAIPLHDADPAVISLVWSADTPHPFVEGLVQLARGLTGDGVAQRPHGDTQPAR